MQLFCCLWLKWFLTQIALEFTSQDPKFLINKYQKSHRCSLLFNIVFSGPETFSQLAFIDCHGWYTGEQDSVGWGFWFINQCSNPHFLIMFTDALKEPAQMELRPLHLLLQRCPGKNLQHGRTRETPPTRNCQYFTFDGKKEFSMWATEGPWEMGDYSEMSGWIQPSHKVLKSRKMGTGEIAQ